MSSCVKNTALAISIIIFMGGTSVASAQDSTSVPSQDNKDIRAWLSFEGGQSISGGFVMQMSANYIRSSHHFSARLLGESPGEGFFQGFHEEGRSELGFLYSRAEKWDWGHASVGTGVAVLWGETASGSVTWTTAGLPVQATLYLTIPYRPIDWLGLKIGGHANLNPEDSFAGATVGLVIGKLR
jgi:hypothetical protein